MSSTRLSIFFVLLFPCHVHADNTLPTSTFFVESNGKMMRKELEGNRAQASVRLHVETHENEEPHENNAGASEGSETILSRGNDNHAGASEGNETILSRGNDISVSGQEAGEKQPDEQQSSSVYVPPNFGDSPPPNKRVVPPPTEDIFDITIDSTCTGRWNYYFLDHAPMTYRHASDRCREIPECIGFDWTFDTCRLFTQKAVDVRRWKVQFNATTGGPYGGDGAYVQKTSELGVLAEEIGLETEKQGCYVRKNPLDVDAYYNMIGEGTCTGGNQTWKRYAAAIEHRQECEDICNKRDECIAIDFINASAPTCNLYTQKPVLHWYGATVTLEEGGGGSIFPASTHVLETADGPPLANCSVKREYYSVDDYYIKGSGVALCEEWNHYKLGATDVQDCKNSCDEHLHCVGFDFDGAQCRLFTSQSIEFVTGSMQEGPAPHNMFAGDPDKLAAASAAAEGDAYGSHGCYKKTHFQTFDSFELVGPNRCNGGGHWNYYELCKTPATYSECSSRCLEQDACVGYDVGQGVCFLYTQWAVAMGSWPDVCFNNGGPFLGGKVTEAYPENAHLHVSKGYPTHNELTMEGRNQSEDNKFNCYKKKLAPARDSRYSIAGKGTCSDGGLWARYSLVLASDRFNLTNLSRDESCAVCFDACNKKDECVGLDCGSWFVEDESVQLKLSEEETIRDIKYGCNMYVQKPVWDWYLVEAEHAGHDPRPMEGTGIHEDLRPVTPRDLLPNSGVYTRYEEKFDTQCWQKNAWVPLHEYYVQIPGRKCATLRHYKFNKTGAEKEALEEACKEKCDMWPSCVGLDVNDVSPFECRLFVSHAVTGLWEEVHSDETETGSTRAFLGLPTETGKADDAFAESGNDLGRRLHSSTIPSGNCFVKTHWHSQKEALDEGDSR